tara:strand:+ start:1341 stop:2201 length:861 start_codon:yes stop_codon:yes gene_type:complete
LVQNLINNDFDVIKLNRKTSTTFDFKKSTLISSSKKKISNFNLNNLYKKISFKKSVVFVHLAAVSKVEDESQVLKKFINSNFLLGLDLLHFMKSNNYKNLIISESFWQFNSIGELKGNSLYAISKSYFSTMANYYADYHKFVVKALVLYDTFGNYDNRPKILNELKRSIKNNLEIKTTAGKQIIDFVHIEDVLSAFTILLDSIYKYPKNKRFERYVVRGLKPLSLNNHIKLIEKIMKVSFNIKWGAIKYSKNQIFNPWLPNKKYLIPGWSPRYKYEHRIKSFFNDE